jgi:hypothetical protein
LKTLAEVAIEAGLVTKAGASKAGRMAEERGVPLVVVLVRDLHVDEVALVGALRKHTRVPLLDPASIQVDAEAVRLVPRAMCARLRVLPLSLAADGAGKVLRLAMADPTDTTAVAEIEQQTGAEIEVSALPLSAIDELLDQGYRSTTEITRPGAMFVTQKGRPRPPEKDSEISVTAQIPLAALQPPPDDLEARFNALLHVLMGKGLVTEAELVEALRKLRS